MLHTIASIFLWIMAGLMVIGLLNTPRTVGKERKPVTGADASRTLIFGTLWLFAIVVVLVGA